MSARPVMRDARRAHCHIPASRDDVMSVPFILPDPILRAKRCSRNKPALVKLCKLRGSCCAEDLASSADVWDAVRSRRWH